MISQAISGLLCLAIMGKRYPVLRFRPGELRPSRTHITRLFAIGVPMGLQYSVTAIGTIVVQTAVNGLGAVSIAAVTAANKVSQLFTCPFDAAGTTMAVYGGQNYGAMKLDRIHRGVRACVLLMFAYSALGLGVLALFGGKLSLLFLDSAESAAVRDQIGLLAQQFLVWNASCYFLLTLVNVLRFLIQGVGFTQQAVFAGVFETIARCFGRLCRRALDRLHRHLPCKPRRMAAGRLLPCPHLLPRHAHSAAPFRAAPRRGLTNACFARIIIP